MEAATMEAATTVTATTETGTITNVIIITVIIVVGTMVAGINRRAAAEFLRLRRKIPLLFLGEEFHAASFK
jgi:hypothetical protein